MTDLNINKCKYYNSNAIGKEYDCKLGRYCKLNSECYYKQLQDKIVECEKKSYLIGNLGYKIHNQRKEINERLKQIEALKKECEKYKQVLNDINDLVSKWYENDIIQYQGDYDEFLAIITKAKDEK